MTTVRRVFLLPDLGEGLTESEIVTWRVAVGEAVTLNQIIGEVETAKAIVELPAPYAGTITRLFAEPGATVNVGEPLVEFDFDDGETPQPSAPDAGSAGGSLTRASAAADDVATVAMPIVPATQPNLVGYGAPAEQSDGQIRRARRRLPTEAITVVPGVTPLATATDAVASAASHHEGERARSTPPVRKMAHDLGIDLEQLQGTGEGGAVTREDVEVAFAERFAKGVSTHSASTAAETSATAASQTTAQGTSVETDAARETRIPIRGVRKSTATAMVQSAFTAPHVTCFLTVDVTRTIDLLAEIKADAAEGDPRIGILALTAYAVGLAAQRTPELNSRWDDAAQEIVHFHYLNLGIAASTPRGLIVPVIREAQAMSLSDIAAAISELSDKARAGSTTPAALHGGTFSISNIGVFGVDAGTPIINPGEAGILALGAVRREPREWQGEIALRSVVTLSLSFDHRLVDGEQGSRFLTDIGALLNNPGRVLTMAPVHSTK